jgi:hypothetical protein
MLLIDFSCIFGPRLMELFETFVFANGKFRLKFLTAHETGDFTPFFTDRALQRCGHVAKRMNLIFIAHLLHLAFLGQQLLSALIENKIFHLFPAGALHSQHEKIKIK